ncbi:HDOD domain-containing protein [Endothiovibrio diazotrophicus]
MSEDKKHDIDYWVRRLGEKEMPVFSHTAQQIAGLAGRNDASIAELVSTILQDAPMTARVLKAANSAYYRPGRGNINTISRAVVVLGLEVVRSLSLSVTLVESFVGGVQREWALREMARAFHSAVQAKAFAKSRGDESPEEVYTTALLYRIGHLAFWFFADNVADRLDNAMRRPGYSPARAEEEQLGFRLDALSARLAGEWKLGSLLKGALEGDPAAADRVRHVSLGHELARTAERGWDSPAFDALMQRITEHLRLPEERVADLVFDNARTAADTAQLAGFSSAQRLIPPPPSADEHLARRRGAAEEGESEEAYLKPDLALQLRILRELSSMMEGRPDLNLLLSMVLEGIYRGIGMDRTLFALLSPDRYFLRGKYSLGWLQKERVSNFEFQAKPPRPHLFSYALERGHPLWVPVNPPAEFAQLITPEIHRVTGGKAFFVMPIVVDGQPIGLFYADRHPSGRELDEESFASFQHFGREANLALSFISLRGK